MKTKENKNIKSFSRTLKFVSSYVVVAMIMISVNGQSINNKKNKTMEVLKNKISDLVFYELPYSYDALEPHFDKMTMEIHYSKHHKAYYDNLMAAMKDSPKAGVSLLELMQNISQYPVGVRNNGGGYFNHHLFWNILSGSPQKTPQGKLKDAIEKDFGSFEAFKEEFENAAKTRFGSGWAWLSLGKDGKLFVSSTPNQDNPFMDVAEKQGYPIMGIDVWEHAYYLKFQNRRPEYVGTYWNVVDWKKVEELYEIALNFK